MNDGSGNSTGALVIFTRLLSKYVKLIQPDLFVICFDSGPSTFRRELFPAYKAARVYNPVESGSWLMLKEFLDLAHLPYVTQEGVEADDLIADYVRRKKPDDKITIVSADKDFFQLLNGWVEIMSPNDPEPWTTFRFRSVYKIHPEHYGKVLALAGDSSDNIPGVPRVGDKTAIKLLNKHGNDLDLVLSEESLMAFQRDRVEQNFKLIDLINAGAMIERLPPLVRFGPTAVDSAEWPALRKFFKDHQMMALMSDWLQGKLWS